MRITFVAVRNVAHDASRVVRAQRVSSITFRAEIIGITLACHTVWNVAKHNTSIAGTKQNIARETRVASSTCAGNALINSTVGKTFIVYSIKSEICITNSTNVWLGTAIAVGNVTSRLTRLGSRVVGVVRLALSTCHCLNITGDT